MPGLLCSKNRSMVWFMRWDHLRLDDQLAADQDTTAGETLFPTGRRDVALPLIERGAVARTFDTPGFRGMTFYEVQAKSVVNRVPEASRMPFRWTINPYRGCQHACRYCVSGETPILMANGRTKPLAAIRVGDEIYGTVKRGLRRQYALTTVLAHWSTVKPAYRLLLADGTRVVTSGDHRFLTERGWRYVTGDGSSPRPHLSLTSNLTGTGGFAEAPKETVGYRRGYLRGISCANGDPDARGACGQLSLRPDAGEALARTAGYLSQASSDSGWPAQSPLDWSQGFLAGIFDAEGSFRRGTVRISSPSPEITSWIVSSMQALGFDCAVAPLEKPGGLGCIRLRGGLRAALRFMHTVDPAITSKRSIEGLAIKSDGKLRVEAIEPLGLDVPMFDITTGTGDFIANGVVSHNCFARNSHTYLDLDAGADFDTKVVVKVNAPELTRKKMASASWHGEHIAMGTNVDCYQRAEGRYQLMPGIISALKDAANPFSILTKGTLILRDIDLLAEAAEITDVGLNVSVGFIDKELWRSLEPGTPAPGRRLEACATLNERGLGCGVLMGPVVPFLSDSPAQLDAAVSQIAATGTTHVSPIVLHLRPGTREWFLRWLGAQHPGLAGRYLELYGRSAYAPKAYQARIAGQVRELAEKHGIGRPRPGLGHGRARRGTGEASRAPEAAAPTLFSSMPSEQLTLL
jgi:DNA repair photolyase